MLFADDNALDAIEHERREAPQSYTGNPFYIPVVVGILFILYGRNLLPCPSQQHETCYPSTTNDSITTCGKYPMGYALAAVESPGSNSSMHHCHED
mmetsp:Transcript_11133/g.22253  ORF Transcript_11133/g.22253 Transcript_11133/m.22253 type:complete len:96 (+) Transcript_11133:1074-1361(+)